MPNDVVIKVENLWKQYRYGTISHASLRKDIQSWWARVRGKEDPNLPVDYEQSAKRKANGSGSMRSALSSLREDEDRFWALKDVSFEVKQGEVLGIIGRNGAGKSTLLKIMSRVTTPTKGQIKLNGRIASLLEVGTGFHPELTGRENIFLNGAILGMTKAEIKKKFDEIVAFAEIEKFIDTPVKRYSSGMYVRLAFAVAAHLEPEILLVDEVLAVGDAQFQKKCLGKMGEVAKEGRTVLFVSHNMAAIQRLCSRAIFLERGKINKDGESRDTIASYLSYTTKDRSELSLRDIRHEDVNQIGYFLSWSVSPSVDGMYSILSGNDISIDLEIKFNKFVRNAYFGIALWSDEGTLIWAANSHDIENRQSFNKGVYVIQFLIKQFALKAGVYWVEVSINSEEGQLDRWYAQPNLTVVPNKPTILPANWQGIIDFNYSFKYQAKN